MCEGKQIKAHRAILSARSDVFQAMFHTHMQESVTGVVEIDDISLNVLYMLVKYCYKAEYDYKGIDVEDNIELYLVADKYNIQQLRTTCCESLLHRLSNENAFKILRCIKLVGTKDDRNYVEDFINKHKLKKVPNDDRDDHDHEIANIVDDDIPEIDSDDFSTIDHEPPCVQEKDIDSEISITIPYVGPIESLNVLRSEYLTDPVYLKKIDDLMVDFPHIRKIKPDGNCFFRAFSFAILELLIGQPEALIKFRSEIKATKSRLEQVYYSHYTVDDFYDEVVKMVDKIEDGLTKNDLEKEFQIPSVADNLVSYLRLVTSAELRASADFYLSFIENKTIEEFCREEVELMGEESDHIHIIALTKALSIPLRIVYMDRGIGAQHMFPDGSHQPSITLLYRPGHYDIIYKSIT